MEELAGTGSVALEALGLKGSWCQRLDVALVGADDLEHRSIVLVISMDLNTRTLSTRAHEAGEPPANLYRAENLDLLILFRMEVEQRLGERVPLRSSYEVPRIRPRG